ncbi:hypothetical protein [uncultured Sunxiuqinia sp.]|uniref:hypothetical protein n=1 Tax=uncultured Sunxiuqinia sp. TaxID=1573825 RepID=UPI0037484CAA
MGKRHGDHLPSCIRVAILLVVAILISISAQNGFLIRNRTAFENLRKVTQLAVDKTGKPTKGNFGITRDQSATKDYDDEAVFKTCESS